MASVTEDAPPGFDERLRQRDVLKQHPLSTIPVTNAPHGDIPNTPLSVATISFVLGAIFLLGIFLALFGERIGFWWSTPPLGFFVAAWSAFHWGEFAVTAGWNLEKCSVDSFLLNNGSMYHIAHGVALLEYVVTLWFFPHLKRFSRASIIGTVVVFAGQILRSTAMIHASTNFSHAVAFKKRASHTLVTDGIYRWFRHPSYAGFYYWALGTQLVLQNPISFVAFAVVLWRFFYYRIRSEEAALTRFFGEGYIHYKQRVGTKIPFIP